MPHDFVREDTGHIYDDIKDDDLAVLAGRGDQKAFSELLNRYTGIIIKQIAGVSPCGMDTDDLMQECSIGLLKAVTKYKKDKDASFRTFAGVCIENRIRSAIRSCGSNKNKPLDGYIELEEYFESAGDSAGSSIDPADSVMLDEAVAELRRRVNGLLSAREARVLELFVTGRSYESIARELGISAKAVDNAMQRVRRKLRKEDMLD